MESVRKERIRWIDIYKAIVIVAMILGHTSGIMTGYVYTFHMAAFFLLVDIPKSLKKRTC